MILKIYSRNFTFLNIYHIGRSSRLDELLWICGLYWVAFVFQYKISCKKKTTKIHNRRSKTLPKITSILKKTAHWIETIVSSLLRCGHRWRSSQRPVQQVGDHFLRRRQKMMTSQKWNIIDLYGQKSYRNRCVLNRVYFAVKSGVQWCCCSRWTNLKLARGC